jgi:hypothetical protein
MNLMSNDEAARIRALAKGDQTAARLRGYMGRGAFRLDRDQLEALTNRGASQDEIRAWFEEQGRRAVAEQAILDELEPELEGCLTGRLGPASTNSRTRRLRVRLPFGAWWQSRRTRR